MERLSELWQQAVEWLATGWELFARPIFTLGTSAISLATILYFLLAFVGLSLISKRLKRVLIDRVLSKTQLENGVKASIWHCRTIPDHPDRQHYHHPKRGN